MMFHFVNWRNAVLKTRWSKLIYMILNSESQHSAWYRHTKQWEPIYDNNDKGLWSPPDEELQDGDVSVMILLLLSFFHFFKLDHGPLEFRKDLNLQWVATLLTSVYWCSRFMSYKVLEFHLFKMRTHAFIGWWTSVGGVYWISGKELRCRAQQNWNKLHHIESTPFCAAATAKTSSDFELHG